MPDAHPEDPRPQAASPEILTRMRAMRSASPVERARRYLERSCGLAHAFQLEVSVEPDLRQTISPTLPETFSSMLILDLLADTEVDLRIKAHLAQYIQSNLHHGLLWFFEDTTLVPPDVDTVAVGLSALARAGAVDLRGPEHAAALDRIVANQTQDGIIEVYFPPCEGRESRIDPVVCANALYLLSLAGREHEARATEDFLLAVLQQRRYLQGTRYYLEPETFLYFLSRAVRASPALQERLLPLMQRRVREALRQRPDTASILPVIAAQRVIAAKNVGLDAPRDTQRLLDTQRPDGSWSANALGATGHLHQRLYFGSRAMTTALALHALSAHPLPVGPDLSPAP